MVCEASPKLVVLSEKTKLQKQLWPVSNNTSLLARHTAKLASISTNAARDLSNMSIGNSGLLRHNLPTSYF